MTNIKVGDIVRLATEINSWEIAEIRGTFVTCIECSESGMTGNMKTVSKDEIIEHTGQF